MVITDAKLRCKASLLGHVWTLLKPLAMFTMLYVVFLQILGTGAAADARSLTHATRGAQSALVPEARHTSARGVRATLAVPLAGEGHAFEVVCDHRIELLA